MKTKDYKNIQVGEKATFSKTITESDISAFVSICGDFNPIHVDEVFAKKSKFRTRIAHGMLTAALIDNTLTGIMGLGGIHISQEVKFLAPVKIGDSIKVVSEVIEKKEARKRLVIKTRMTNQDNELVLEGIAETMMPQ